MGTVQGQRIGYVRVSTVDQNPARQLEGLELAKVFLDRTSGKDTNRPELARMLEFVREGDTVVVHSMDRLARNLDDLRRLVTDLNAQGITVEFVQESLTFTGTDSPMAKLLLSMMGAFAEFERGLLRERQSEGIAIAKASGKYNGRRPALTTSQAAQLREKVANGMPKAEVARQLGVSRSTVYEYLKAER
jgi:DNA invertase Pin-like site-specific DNA recombinase